MTPITGVPAQAEFDRWQQLAPASLTTNADVGDQVIEPMLRWAVEQDATITEVLGGWVRDFKLNWQRRVDFVLVDRGRNPMRALVVAKGVADASPEAGDWTGTQPLDELREEMDEFGCRGMLVTSDEIRLFDTDPDDVPEVLRRQEVTREDLMDRLRYFPIRGRYF